ncbi:MAG: putative photosynthetic complex assembly protein PuhC [Pseudomonadota bacterium]|jgi:putative photosynthetic complex assembly protein
MPADSLTHPPVPASTGSGVIPRWALIAAALVVGATLALVAILRLNGFDPAQAPAEVVAERLLRFADAADGAVVVHDARTGEAVATMRGEQGFLRGVLRGLARERRARDVPASEPYVLSLRADARLLIHDPSAGQRIDLASFGPDNAAVFLRWLPASLSTGVPR